MNPIRHLRDTQLDPTLTLQLAPFVTYVEDDKVYIYWLTPTQSTLINKPMIYRISALTPEEGRVVFDTMDEVLARRVHSNLMGRQLNPNDFTSEVTIKVIKWTQFVIWGQHN